MRNKRRDGVRVKGLDGYHNILPYVMPKRTEAEVSLTEQFDVTDLVKYMKERNEEEGVNIKIFHSIVTAVARTVYHRPRLNWFISGRAFYERPDITFSFVVNLNYCFRFFLCKTGENLYIISPNRSPWTGLDASAVVSFLSIFCTSFIFFNV